MAEKDLPVQVKSDYTQKPQKPITLKPGIAEEKLNAVSWTRPPGEILGSSAEQESDVPLADEAPAVATVEWTLHDISAETRDEAIECARLEGVPVGEWVDRILRDVLFEPIPEEMSDEEYAESDEEYEEYEEAYEEHNQPQYVAAEPVDDTMAQVAQVAEPAPVPLQSPPQTPAPVTREPSAPSPDLQNVLREISDRLAALERRRGFWDSIRSLFTGK